MGERKRKYSLFELWFLGVRVIVSTPINLLGKIWDSVYTKVMYVEYESPYGPALKERW